MADIGPFIIGLLTALLSAVIYFYINWKRAAIERRFHLDDLEVTLESGKKQKYKISGPMDSESIQSVIREEIELEQMVERSLTKLTKKHPGLEFEKSSDVDFIIHYRSKGYALEARAQCGMPSKRFKSQVTKHHPSVEDYVFIFENSIPKLFLDSYQSDKHVRLIKAKGQNEITKKLENVLDFQATA